MIKKIITGIVLLGLAVGIGFGGYWLFTNIESIADGVNGTTLYTSTQMEENYQLGYNDGSGAVESLEEQLVSYQELVTQYELEIATKSDTITSLTTSNSTLTNNIAVLNSSIESLESEIAGLESDIESLENDIEELEEEYLEYVAGLTDDYDETIFALSSLNESYLTQITSLNNTIATLNSQIVTLQGLVSSYSFVISENNATIVNLNSQISDLTTQNTYYIALIESLNADNMAVVYFMLEDSTFNYQVTTKGSYVTVSTPSDTVNYSFLGWSTDGETIIDLTETAITANTTFYAVLEYNYFVEFVVNDVTVDSGYVTSGDYASTTYSYTDSDEIEFVGWYVYDSLVTLTTYTIYEDTTFVAGFNYYYLTQFYFDDVLVDSSYVAANSYATTSSENTTTYEDKEFFGWCLEDGTQIDLTTYQINANTNIYAEFSYLVSFIDYGQVNLDTTSSGGSTDCEYYEYVVDSAFLTSMDDYEPDESNIMTKGYYFSFGSLLSVDGYTFMGWSLDGVNVIDISTISVSSPINFYAVFDYLIYEFDEEAESYTIIGFINNIITELIIPDYYNGYPVTKIADTTSMSWSVLKSLSKTSLTSVIIGDNITYIGEYAFYNSTSLVTVTFGSNVTYLGYGAFHSCSSLSSVVLNDNLEYIDSAAFYSCSSLIEINIPDSVTEIGYEVFLGCSSLETVVIGSGMTTMGNNSFRSLSSLSTVTIYSMSISVGSYSFYDNDGVDLYIYENCDTNISYFKFENVYYLE